MDRSNPQVVIRFVVDEQSFSLPLLDQIGYGLTPREAGRVKRLAGGIAGTEIIEAVSKVDIEVMTALAVIAMERAGATPNVEAILDGKVPVAVDIDTEPVAVPPGAVVEAASEDGMSPTTTPILVGTGVPS